MNKKKLLYSLASVTTVVGSLTTLVACSRPKDSENTSKIKNFFGKSIPEVLNNITKDKKISIYDLESFNLGSKITDTEFEKIFGQKLPPLEILEDSENAKLGVFLTKKTEKQIELLFKLTWGINKLEPTQEFRKSFSLTLKELSKKEREAKLSALIETFNINETYETDLKDKTVSELPNKNTVVDFKDLGIESHFKNIENIKITAQITEKNEKENKIKVDLIFSKFGVTSTKSIFITGFKNLELIKNKKSLNEIKTKILENQKDLKYDAAFVSIQKEGTLELEKFIDEVSKQLKNDHKEVTFKFEVTNKEADKLNVKITLSKGSGNELATEEFGIELLKTQFNSDENKTY